MNRKFLHIEFDSYDIIFFVCSRYTAKTIDHIFLNDYTITLSKTTYHEHNKHILNSEIQEGCRVPLRDQTLYTNLIKLYKQIVQRRLNQ